MMRRDRIEPSLVEFFRVHSTSMLGTILIVAVLDGVFAGWVTIHLDAELANLHVSIWAFLLVWAAMVGYTAYKRVPSGVLGMGLYVMGLLVLVKPLAWFLPRVAFHRASGDNIAATRSLADLFVWGLVFAVLACLLFAVGNYFRNRAESTVFRIARRRLRYLEE